MKNTINDNILFSRNWLFISKKIQDKMKEKAIFIAGIGMGSFVAEMAVRLGFKNIIIADGDTVSLSNLNRQNYTIDDIGKTKVDSLRKRLLKINKNLNLICINKFLDEKLLIQYIKKSDFIINTIDFDCPEFLLCHLLCKKHKKIELFPINIGFGSAVFVNDKTTTSFVDYFGADFKQRIIMHIINNQKSSKLKLQVKEYFRKIKQIGYDPQNCLATFSASIYILTIIIKILNKENIKKFPQYHHSDYDHIV